MKCVRKEQFECVYLTKQNRDEFLKKFEPNIKCRATSKKEKEN